MNIRRPTTIVLTAVFLVVFGFAIGISAATKDSPLDPRDAGTPDMVIEDDVVSEWHNEKMTELKRLTDFARSAETAKEGPVLIFKHSTTCPISGRAAQRMDKMLRETDEALPKFYMVKVIESRPVSNAIEGMYEVKHESPQILLIKDGKAVWNTSHDEITAEAVLDALEEFDAKPEPEADTETADETE